MNKSYKRKDWLNCAIRRARIEHRCELCDDPINPKDRFYDGELGRRAHENCVKKIYGVRDDIDESEMFVSELQPTNKPCYNGIKGFVHVFNSGSYICNCGEKKGESMEEKYVGNSRFYIVK